MARVNLIFREPLEFRALVGKINHRHLAAPEFKLQNGVAAKNADLVVPFAQRRGSRAGDAGESAIFKRDGQSVVDVILRTVVVKTGVPSTELEGVSPFMKPEIV